MLFIAIISLIVKQIRINTDKRLESQNLAISMTQDYAFQKISFKLYSVIVIAQIKKDS